MWSCLLAMSMLLIGAAGTAGEVINAKLDQAQTLSLGANKFAVAGNFTDGFVVLGEKGLSFPVRGLMKDTGTVFAKVKLLPTLEPILMPRYLLTLRTASRLTAGFVFFPDARALQFGFGDRAKQFHHRFKEKMEFNREYALGFTYDGSVVRIYVDGKMAAEYPQPLPMAAEVRNINIGPYKDGWNAPKPWGNDTLFSEIRVWDTALSPTRMAELSNVEFKPLHESQPSALTAPARHGDAPVIDGELGEEMWKFAAAMPRLVYGNFPEKSGSLPPHDFKITYDDKNLYCGFSTLFPGGAPLQKGNLRTPEQEPEVWGSESFELYLVVGKDVYRFAGNVAGGTTEWRGVDAKWDGAWDYKTTLKMRIDDSLLWSGEIAIPWATLGLNGAPQTPIGFNFCRSWKLPEVGTHSSLNFNGKKYNENFVPLTFGPAPTLQILNQNDPGNGEYTQEIALGSISGGKVHYVLALAKLDGSAEPMELFNRDFTLKPGEYFTEKLSNKIAVPGYDCLLYTLSSGNGKLAMRELVPFKLSEEYLAVRKLFLHEKLLVTLKEAMLKGKFGPQFVPDLRLTGPDGKVFCRMKAPGVEAEIAFPRANPAGKYTLDLLNPADGAVLNTKEFNYPGIGEWEKITFDNRIIPPFTALRTQSAADGMSSSMWNREYEWKKSLFPVRVNSADVSMLAAPVELEINGETVQNARFKTGKIADHRAEFDAEAETAAAQVANSGWVEYDGVNWNEVTLTAKQPLRNVRLRMIMPKALAKYIHASGSGGWASQITGLVGDQKRSLPFHPVVWLGMEDKGLCFFAESRADWTSPAQSSYTLEPVGDNAIALNVELAPALAAGKTLKFGFGLLASPVRPRPENYPFNTLSWNYTTPLNRPGRAPVNYVAYIANQESGDLGSFFGDQDTPECRMSIEGNRKRAKTSHANGSLPIPYTCARYLSVRYPEMAAFKDEWEMLPEVAMDYNHTGHFVYDCCPTTGASAFFAMHAKQMFKEIPELRGMYFDFGTIEECGNALHGCRQRFALLGQREFYRRIALAQLDAGIKDPVIVAHNTDKLLLPAFTFVTHLLNGERVRQASSSILHNKKDVLDTYGIPIFASELATLPFGISNSVYMPCDKLAARFGGDEEEEPYKFRMTKAVMAATLIHHTMPCLWRLHYGIFDKVLRAYEDFGVPQAKFTGYWDAPAKVINGQDIYVSVFTAQDGKSALAIIGHVGKEHLNQEFSIEFDLAKLGLGKLSKAVDKMTAADPDYQWLFEQRKAQGVPVTRAPLALGDFGSEVTGFDGKTLKMKLAFHSFAIVELTE